MFLAMLNSLLTSSKISFPGVSLARKARLLTQSMQPLPQIQPPMFLAMLTLHTQGLPTHGMTAACLRDILIYSLPHISLPVSNPNTIYHSRLNVFLIDYLDCNLCLSFVFWLSACEETGSCDFAFVGAVEILSLGLRLQHQNYRMIAVYKRRKNNKLIHHNFNYL